MKINVLATVFIIFLIMSSKSEVYCSDNVGSPGSAIKLYGEISTDGIEIDGLRIWIRDDTVIKNHVELIISGGTRTMVGLSLKILHPNGTDLSKNAIKIEHLPAGALMRLEVPIKQKPRLNIGDRADPFGNANDDYPTIKVIAGKAK